MIFTDVPKWVIIVVLGIVATLSVYKITSYYKQSILNEYELKIEREINKNINKRQKEEDYVEGLSNYDTCRELNGLHDDCK